MARRYGSRRGSPRGPRRRRRAFGCAMWLLIAVVILLLLSLLFGGFQKGAKSGLGSVTPQRVQPSAQEVALGRVAGSLDRGRVGAGGLARPAEAAQEVSADSVE
jgi:hypothetical protein